MSRSTDQCDQCARDYFRLESSRQSCWYCGTSNEGVECLGTQEIIISAGYWCKLNIEDGEYWDNQEIVMSSSCPAGYCCQKIDGCRYLDDKSSLCAANRNVSVPLCGKCNDGFSEMLGTSDCGFVFSLFSLSLSLSLAQEMSFHFFLSFTAHT